MSKLVKRFPSLFPTEFHFPDFDSMMNNLFQGPSDIMKVFDDQWNMSLSGFPRGDEFVDKEGNLTIELATAGYSKDQLNISIESDRLIISANKCEGGDKTNRSLSRRAFKKEFCDPGHQWDLENTSASYQNGLLKVVIPPAQKKTVNVKLVEIK